MSDEREGCSDCDSPYHRRCRPAVVRIAVPLVEDTVTCTSCRTIRPMEAIRCPRCQLTAPQALLFAGLVAGLEP